MLPKSARSSIPDATVENIEATPAEPPRRKSAAIWLAVLGVSLLFVPLSLAARTLQQDNAGLEIALGQAQTAAASEPTLPPEAQNLQATLAQVQAQINLLAPVQQQLAAEHVNWPEIMAVISDHDDTQAALTGLTQTENRLVITGHASNDTEVMLYAQALENSGRFSRVVVQSITRLATPLFVTATQTGLVNTPPPIFMKQPLNEIFETAQDEDKAVFLAKANRFYEVSTMKLAPGVDTILTVTLDNGTTYTNDDTGPGTLASKISFQAPSENTQVLIRVANLGQAGPEMGYQLVAQEIIPTPTPTARKTLASSDSGSETLASATPTLEPTAPPTQTAAPTVAASSAPMLTATPDPGYTQSAAQAGAVEFAILVEVKRQAP